MPIASSRPLTFAEADPGFREVFLEVCAGLVFVPHFEPVLDFCLEGGLDPGGPPLVRISDIIRDNKSPAYRSYTGAGPRSPKRAAERGRADDHLLQDTGHLSAGTLVELACPTFWPDGGADLFKATTCAPQGLSTIAIARCADRVSGARRDALSDLLRRLHAAGHRAPLYSVDKAGALVGALLRVAFELDRRVEWIGCVSPRQRIDDLGLEVTQPGAGDVIDIGDLLDNTIATVNGEAFAHASLNGRVLLAYRPWPEGPCYVHVCHLRRGATFAYLQDHMRRAVTAVERLRVPVASAPLERFYAVNKAQASGTARAAAAAPYRHAIQMLLLACHYPLFAARQAGEGDLSTTAPAGGPPSPPAPASLDIADREKNR